MNETMKARAEHLKRTPGLEDVIWSHEIKSFFKGDIQKAKDFFTSYGLYTKIDEQQGALLVKNGVGRG